MGKEKHKSVPFINKEITLISKDGEMFENDTQWENILQNL